MTSLLETIDQTTPSCPLPEGPRWASLTLSNKVTPRDIPTSITREKVERSWIPALTVLIHSVNLARNLIVYVSQLLPLALLGRVKVKS